MATIEEAKNYLARGFNVMPCITEPKSDGKVNKRPRLHTWKEFQVKRVTEVQLESWWRMYPNSDIGTVTGGTAGFFVIDLDLGYSEADFKKFNLTDTLMAETPSGGRHYYYKHPGKFLINNVSPAHPSVKSIDVRGDGGFVMMPPSAYPDGRQYRWLNDLPIAEASKETLELVRKREGKAGYRKNDYSTLAKGLTTGGRTDAAISIAGSLLLHMPESIWDSLCWQLVRLVNRENDPPLDEKKLRKDFMGIAQRELEKRKNNPK